MSAVNDTGVPPGNNRINIRLPGTTFYLVVLNIFPLLKSIRHEQIAIGNVAG